MELAPEQDRVVQRIMKEVDCPKHFRCYEAGFENLCRALVYRGANAVQCHCEGQQYCPMSHVFCNDIRFCKCPLRRYVALELGI